MVGTQRRFLCTSILATVGTLACADETVPSTDGGISQSTSSSTSGPSDSGEDTGNGEAETDTGDPDPDPDPDPECGNAEVEDGEACDDGNDVHDDACTNDCTAAACGDGIVQSGEECDGGANNGPNSACLDSCESNVCGDGFVGPGEACDDGNDIDDDTCSNDCAPVTCGDGQVDAENGEQCDDGNADNADGCIDTCVTASCGDGYVQLLEEECDDGPQNSDSAGCTNVCKAAVCGDSLVNEDIEDCDNGPDNGPDDACLDGCIDNVCGDGFLGPTEGCDDANVQDDDGCSSTCELEGCGDGITQDNEECDDGQNGDHDDGCTDACRLEACGDELVQDGEQCDEGNDNTDSGACTSICTVAMCGDGFVWENNEQCDSGDANGNQAECTLACTDAVCGDGFVGPGEGCDDGGNQPGDGCGPTCISEVCGNGIVQPGETCDDGNDDDDDECTNGCTIPIPCDGPYVSKDTCVPGDQCGTIVRPWCTIDAGLDNSVTSPVRVAETGTQYYEHVVMRDGIDLLGGYEPTFQQPRDPVAHPTKILSNFEAVQWFGGVDATLDGFTVETEGPWDNDPIPLEHEIIVISSSANATLANVIVRPLNFDVYADEGAFAVSIRGGGGGGSVVVSGQSIITGPRAYDRSVGLLVEDGVTLAGLTINGARIQGGQATLSYGVHDLGFGPGSFIGAELRGGAGTTGSAGFIGGRDGHGGVTLQATTLHGGVSRAATGVDYRHGTQLQISGGTITGGGVANINTISIGVLTDGVDELIIDGVTARGSDVVNATKVASSAALDLRNTGLVPMTGATVTAVVLDGGSSATLARGLRDQGVPLDLSTSTIRGSTSQSGTGVHFYGAALPGASVTIHDNVAIVGTSFNAASGTAILIESPQPIDITHNPLITGCTAVNGCLTGVGVRGSAQAPVTITDNDRLSGCETPSRTCAAAVFVNAAGGHVISNNVEIVGGPSNGIVGTHHGISIDYSSATVNDNQLISGAADPMNRGRQGYGIELRNGTLSAERNALITGGYSYHAMLFDADTIGVWAHAAGQELNTITLRDNYIIGGEASSESFGLLFETRVRATVERNVVRVCPYDTHDPRCVEANRTTAMATVGDLGSVYVNNYFFGGYDGHSGCVIGCDINYTCSEDEPLLLRFEHNLCTVEDGGSALRIENFHNANGERPYIANNIFHVYHWSDVGVRYRNDGGPNRSFDFHHNDVVTPWGCLVQYDNSGICAKTGDEINGLNGNGDLFASDNVSIDPSHVDPDPMWHTVEGYHLDQSCALRDLGEVTQINDFDFDGDPRGEGNPDLPEIGPDECLN